MEFGNPHLLIHLAWLLPAVAGVVWFGVSRRRRGLEAIASGEEQRKRLTASVSIPKRSIRTILLVLGIVCSFAALLRPQLGVETLGRPVIGRDVLVVLDVSRSMLAKDAKPSRLDGAKAFVEDLVDALPGDRFGLVAFAGKPQLFCPITANRLGFRMVLSNTDTRSVPYGGTNLQAALKRALEAFEGAEAEFRAIVLLSDGEELQGNVQQILGKLRERGIALHVVGVGDASDGALIQLDDGSFVEENNERVRTRLNENALRSIAEAGRGVYVHSTLQRPGIERVAKQIRNLNRREVGVVKSIRPIERYQIPLGMAVLCMLAFFLLGERTRGTTATPVAVLLLMACNVSAAPPATRPDPRVRRLKQQIQDEKDPVEKVRLKYNLARNFQELKQLDRVEILYDEILQDRHAPTALRAAVFQNLGAVRHAAGDAAMADDPDTAALRFGEAIQHYEESLRLKTDDDVAHNLALARMRLKAAKKKAREKREAEQRRQDALDKVRQALQRQEEANADQDAEDWQQEQEKASTTTKEAEKPVTRLANKDAIQFLEAAMKSQQTAVKTESEVERRGAGVQAAVHLKQILKLLGAGTDEEERAAGRQRKPKGKPQINPEKDPKVDPQTAAALAILRKAKEEERDLIERIKKKNEPLYKHRERGKKNW